MKQHKDIALLNRMGQRLKELRHERGLTQEQVFFDTGKNIGSYEIGSVNLTICILHVLCKYYGVPLEEFFKNTGM